MSLRTIMIFPEFDNMEIIDELRNKYDPLAKLVRPHITIVFPFESEMTNEELSNILDKRLENFKPFSIRLGGISKAEDQFGYYLFLEIVEGLEQIKRLHDLLYENEFAPWNLGLSYVPHMTVGKLADGEALQNAFEETKSCEAVFTTRVNKISVEMIGEHEESVIVIEKTL